MRIHAGTKEFYLFDLAVAVLCSPKYGDSQSSERSVKHGENGEGLEGHAEGRVPDEEDFLEGGPDPQPDQLHENARPVQQVHSLPQWSN